MADSKLSPDVKIPADALTVQGMLRAGGWVPLGADCAYWNPPSGGNALPTEAAAASMVEFWNTSRKAILQKHFLATSEFWMAASGPLLGAPMAVAGLAGAADFLGPPWAAVVTGFCGFVAVAGPAAYKVSRMIAKWLAAREGITIPDEAPK